MKEAPARGGERARRSGQGVQHRAAAASEHVRDAPSLSTAADEPPAADVVVLVPAQDELYPGALEERREPVLEMAQLRDVPWLRVHVLRVCGLVEEREVALFELA